MTHPLQNTIDLAWEGRAELTPTNSPEVRSAVEQVIADLDKGLLRIAERQSVGQWRLSLIHI
ncbi:MAG: 2,3,4,5-tetrahydropyridine-2,6-dicarboxylate N-succinyltransferase, partial [Burkholderiaceae bacterium]